jgi:hypothetical protein
MCDALEIENIFDLGVFKQIPSQTSDYDKRGLLMCRAAVKNLT